MWGYDSASRIKIVFLREKPSLQVLGQSGDPGKENPKLYEFLSILPGNLLEHTVNSCWVMSQWRQVFMYYTYLQCNSSPLGFKRLNGTIIYTLWRPGYLWLVPKEIPNPREFPRREHLPRLILKRKNHKPEFLRAKDNQKLPRFSLRVPQQEPQLKDPQEVDR